MKEELLHYVWRLRKFDHTDLRTSDGSSVEILFPGEHNHDAGPDFLHAKIMLADTLWVGNVEMHLRSSDWVRHQHSEDPAYKNVILHVVLEEDQPVFHPRDAPLPCLILKNRIDPRLVKTYQKLLRNEQWIPCQSLFYQALDTPIQLWLDRLLVERLEAKTELIARLLERNQQDWEETFYQLLARNFGLFINADAFENLARSLPLRLLLKHRERLLQLEALLFGQAGFLTPALEGEYPQALWKEYDFLRKKYQLRPIPGEMWKFSRLRPANFPTVRIAQFAAFFYQTAHLFSKILAVRSVAEIENLFSLKLSNYWQTHYTFGKESARRMKTLGQDTIHLLVINAISPMLFYYGLYKQDQRYKDRALLFLETLPPEVNSTVGAWKDLGVEVPSAYQSQALLQLKKQYCDQKKCLQCAIGHTIFSAAPQRMAGKTE